jgi:lipopolysaccharide export system permease protein
MKILRDHVISEFLNPFVMSLVGLISLFLLGRGIIQMADFIFNKSVDFWLVAQLLLYSLPFMLIFVIPMAVLVATIIAFRKLSADNELTALRASGVSISKLTSPLFVVVFILCLVSLLLSDKVASVSHYHYRVLLAKIGLENPSAALEEGTFIKTFKNFVIFIYEIDKNKLKGIRIYQPQEGRPARTIVAQKGELISIPERGIIKLKLVHGTSDEPDPKDPTKLYKLNFKTYDLPLNLSDLKGEANKPGKKAKDMSIRELRSEIERLGEAGIKATYSLSAEIHNKIAMAFSSFALLLIGIPLGITTKRGDKSVSYAMSLIVFVFYWTLLIGGKALAQKGMAPPLLALQFANVFIGLIGFWMYRRLVRT